MAAQHSFWRTHTFVMIYASTCPHCHHQAEVLAPLVASENIAYTLYSLDNKPLPQFEQFRPIPNSLLQVAYPDGKVSYPALFIIDNQSLKLYPISYGFLDAYELNNRLDGLREKITQYEANTYAS
jgi:thiol-disulfide isomerase/thioredoxin